MRLVLDTNVLLKGLIKDSRVRAVLLSPAHRYLVPEHAVNETLRHMPLVARKSGLSEKQVRVVLNTLLSNVEVVPLAAFRAKWEEAEEEMGDIDKGDIPFLAVALSVGCDGIWSDDAHLRRQRKVSVFTTKEIVGMA